jgi:hypothetical protein
MKFILNLSFFIFCFLSIPASAEVLGMEETLNTRPSENGNPTIVNVGIYVIDIETIDNVHQHFVADFMLLVRWKDERLKGEPRTVDINDIWWPNIEVLNGRDLSMELPHRAEIDEDGNVLYRQRYYGNMATQLDLREFPFDTQKLPIKVLTLGHDSTQISIQFATDVSGNVDNFSNSDWEIENGKGMSGLFKTHSLTKDKIALPMVTFEFTAKRHVFYYVWKVIIPLMVIVMMSWAIFYIEPSQVAPQLGLAATSILTLIAFLFSLGKILPPIAYLTKIDFFVYGSLGLVFLAFAEAMITINLAGMNKLHRAKQVDRISRWFFPIVFILILVLVYFF